MLVLALSRYNRHHLQLFVQPQCCLMSTPLFRYSTSRAHEREKSPAERRSCEKNAVSLA